MELSDRPSNKDLRRDELDALLAAGKITKAQWTEQMTRTHSHGGSSEGRAKYRQDIRLIHKLQARGTIDQTEHALRLARIIEEMQRAHYRMDEIKMVIEDSRLEAKS